MLRNLKLVYFQALLVSLLSALSPCTAHAQEAAPEDQSVHVLTDSPPELGFHGTYTQRVRALLGKAGIRYDLQQVSWPRAYARAQTDRNILLYAITRTSKREDSFHWILPLVSSDFHLMGRSDLKPLGLDKSNILSGRFNAICERQTVQCDMLEEYGFQSEKTLMPVGSTMETRLNLILRGRADFTISQETAINHILAESGLPTGSIVSFGVAFPNVTDYLAAGKKFDPELLERLQEAMASDAATPTRP